jgi:FixJ family two-component response regulator
MESAEHFAMEFASAEEFLASGFTQETDCLILDVQLPASTGSTCKISWRSWVADSQSFS